jgi:hypothetical protein
MSGDPTLSQGDSDRRHSQELSLRRAQPPAQVPGYDIETFLGEGAYGEVWVGVERNTGRRVAIKFYAHRNGLDWSLLSREVEKLAFLFADRYVVQLIGVGWDAEPPYYIMEHLERGSLAERLQAGPLRVAEAVELFRDVAVGLLHAHGKGVLHCDLKPANVLLDQDGKPRLADFGQSRLSHEQVPALGTLFYMAPEQADLKSVPDARWDVYALGALLHCMLTGSPPYRDEREAEALERAGDLESRLSAYRQMIRGAPAPSAHRQVPGVDRALAEIVDRCLAADPAKRYPNVQAVLDALDARAVRRAMRPIMILGAAGPILLLLVVSLFASQGSGTALRRSEEALVVRALDDNLLTAGYVAGLASKELQRRYEAVEQVARSKRLREAVARSLAKPEVVEILGKLSDPARAESELEPLRRQFLEHADRRAFQKEFDAMIPGWMRPAEGNGKDEAEEVASWFFCDTNGVSTARVPESTTLGRNYAWRSFFHGGARDLEKTVRPGTGGHLKATMLSAVFQSQATGSWIVAVASPVFEIEAGGKFLGVVALTVKVNRFVELERTRNLFAVLVDLRPGDHTGMILQHPLFDELRPPRPAVPAESEQARPDLWAEYRRQDQKYRTVLIPEYRKTLESFQQYRLTPEDLPATPARQRDYRDPLASDHKGEAYAGQWLAQFRPVELRQGDVGWGVIVQESYETAIGSTLARLRSSLVGYGLAALAMVVLLLFGLWGLTFRLLGESAPFPGRGSPGGTTERGAAPSTARGPGEFGSRVGSGRN